MINFRHLKNLIRKQFYQFYSKGCIWVCLIHFWSTEPFEGNAVTLEYSHFVTFQAWHCVEGYRFSFLFFQSVENIVAVVNMPISIPQPIEETFPYGTLHWRLCAIQWCSHRFLCLFPNSLYTCGSHSEV